MKRLGHVLLALASAPAGAWAAEEGVNVIPNDLGLQLWVVLTFVVMLVLLAKFAFKPIADALDRRGQAIKAAVEDAEKARADAKKMMEDYRQQLAAARAEATQIIEESRQVGERVRQEVVEKARAEASALLQRAQEEIARQQEKGVQELKETVATLAVQVAAKVLEKEVNPATHQELVTKLIADLSKMQKV